MIFKFKSSGNVFLNHIAYDFIANDSLLDVDNCLLSIMAKNVIKRKNISTSTEAIAPVRVVPLHLLVINRSTLYKLLTKSY